MIDRTTWSEFLDEVAKKRSEFGCSQSGAYFRGQGSVDYSLIPTLLRSQQLAEREGEMYYQCHVMAGGHLPQSRSSWETLATMQHHNIPTRLLDWSQSFAVALFFAVSGNSPSPCLWILNSFKLTRTNAQLGENMVFTVGIDALPEYDDAFVSPPNPMWPYDKPVFLEVPWVDERMRSQRGFFTIHPNGQCMAENSKSSLRQVCIPTDAGEAIAEFLRLSDVNAYSIFADLDSLGHHFRTRFLEPGR